MEVKRSLSVQCPVSKNGNPDQTGESGRTLQNHNSGSLGKYLIKSLQEQKRGKLAFISLHNFATFPFLLSKKGGGAF